MDAQSALRKIFTTIVLTASLQGCGGGSDDTGRQSSAAADSTRATSPTAPMPVPANVPPPVTSATTTPAPVAMAIESVAASSGPPGAVLSAHGHGFTRGTRLLWGDQALPAVFQSAMLMTFTLPPTHSGMAVSKTLTAMREDGTSSMAPSLVTVEGVPEPTGMTPTAARTGQLIRITGTGLKLVTRVMVTGIGATIQNIAEDGSWLDFIVPDGAGSGSVTLPSYTINDAAGKPHEYHTVGSPFFAAAGDAAADKAVASGERSTAAGAGASATGTKATATGAGAVASANGATAIGAGASATADNAVAIGAGAVADRANAVSFGSVGQERMLTNVASVDPTDAANATSAINAATMNSAITQSAAQTLQSANQYTDRAISQMADRVNDVDRSAVRGIAAASALNNVTPYLPGRTSMNAGIAVYRGAPAIGVTVSRWNQKGNINLNGGVSSAGGNSTIVRVGAGFVF